MSRRARISSIISAEEAAGSWFDVGEGECQRCAETRRLYTPSARLDIRVCSKCSQVYARAILPDRDQACSAPSLHDRAMASGQVCRSCGMEPRDQEATA